MISDIGLSFKIINASCIEIAENKTNREVNEMLVEELSELIKAVIKLERWDMGEITLRYNIDEIHNNLYEEMGDVIIMILQFIYKNKIEYKELLNEILLNSQDRNMKERIIIFDDKGDYYIFKHSNIMERVKQMKVERFEIVSEKLIVMKVEGVINE